MIEQTRSQETCGSPSVWGVGRTGGSAHGSGVLDVRTGKLVNEAEPIG